MQYKMTENTVFPLVEVDLRTGESIQLESGAMVYHNGEITLEGKMNSNGKSGLGGAIRALGRSMSSGESFFITKASGLTDTAKVALAPATPGAIKELQVGSEHWRLNTGAFLACDASVSYNMKRQKLSGAIFGGTGGLFVMETAGSGSLLINSYGDIVEIQLDGTKPFVVDNQHVVAWSESLDYNIKVASGIFGFTTGEGVVNEFHGTGTIMIQTRNIEGLAGLISPFVSTGS
ncbi:TIGR00266 family protein [Enterococcus caccae]|uniref:TIGR00266 family protein n=1 Tax=Enterococcus caccae ATCC BAA-1240 TaxID=1158612 RepID=R3TYX6_9ENTE|nr:TIGR00266 family protein [Enterococcus caccae]EOL46378.1 TIGR00266 family protein [Enterococcus caccae ATCC BAA-1240]EOT60747.1 TIGR00266 family protein [Enterococcus caccae ATCC BAA-1240]